MSVAAVFRLDCSMQAAIGKSSFSVTETLYAKLTSLR